ncbi:MAG: NTP transferase domain-containing protein [Pseudomonadales bacterium]
MTRLRAIVLAGERPGGGALAQALNLPAGVLAPLAGRPCIEHVVEALRAAECVSDLVLSGPERTVVDAAPVLTALLDAPDVSWVAPAPGPAASALAAAGDGPYPLLLTAGDHGLLSAAIVDGFCRAAARLEADVVVGLVPHAEVALAYPESRRTVLRFRDGAYCGSNLFALLTPASGAALEFWKQVETDRKRPWRIARRLGVLTLLRYLGGRLGVDAAFAELSRRSGCRVGWVEVAAARAAVDVDSEADWRLADRILAADDTAHAHDAP